jgi:thioredoxin 1
MAGRSTLEFTDTNFDNEVVQSEVPVVVDFWAEWCGPCRMLAPTIDAIADEYAGKVKVGKLDTETNRSAAMKYRINMLPTILVFKGGEVVHKFVGLTKLAEFQQVLNSHVSK